MIWPFQLAFSGSMIAGLAALLASSAATHRRSLRLCAGGRPLSFSSLGLAFAVGVAVHVLTGADRGSRWWVAVVPTGSSGSGGWAGAATPRLAQPQDALTAPSYVLDGLASSLVSLLGLSADALTRSLGGRRRAAAAGDRRRLRRLALLPAGSGAAGLWVVPAILLSFWLLAALNSNLLRRRPPSATS